MSKDISDRSRIEHEGYLQHREFLMQGALEESKSFEKYLVTLSGGALGLSIAVVKDIVSNPASETRWLLVATWFLFGGSLVFSLISFFIGQFAWRWQCDLLDLHYEGVLKESRNWWAIAVVALQGLSLAILLLGVAALGAFLAKNFMMCK